jgi:hypothetical protein
MGISYFLWFLLLSHISSQKLIKKYPAGQCLTKSAGEYLLVPRSNSLEIWNNTNQKLLRTVEYNYLSNSLWIDKEYYYKLMGDSIYKYFLSNSSLSFIYTTSYPFTGPPEQPCVTMINSKYIYVMTLRPGNQKFIEIREKTKFRLINSVFFGNEPLRINGTYSVDENGLYIMSGVDSTISNLQKFDIQGNFSWAIILDLPISRAVVIGAYPYVFLPLSNLIYQLSSENGDIIRVLNINSLSLADLVFNNGFIYALSINSEVHQFSVLEGNYITTYGAFQAHYNAFGSVSVSNNYVFFTALDPSGPACEGNLFIYGCCQGMHIQQYQITTSSIPTSFTYTNAAEKFESSTNIMHSKIPSERGLNTATFFNRFSSIRKVLRQNSFFSPAMYEDSNRDWNLIYFSGGGSLFSGTCADIFTHRITLTTFNMSDDNTALFTEKSFDAMSSLADGYHCDFTSDRKRMSTTYDYASLLITDDTNYYYVIHGGCACFTQTQKNDMYVIVILPDLTISALQIVYQNTIFNA